MSAYFNMYVSRYVTKRVWFVATFVMHGMSVLEHSLDMVMMDGRLL